MKKALLKKRLSELIAEDRLSEIPDLLAKHFQAQKLGGTVLVMMAASSIQGLAAKREIVHLRNLIAHTLEMFEKALRPCTPSTRK